MNKFSHPFSRTLIAVVAVTTALSAISAMQTAESADGAHTKKTAAGAKIKVSGQLPVWSQNVKVPIRSWIPLDKPRQILLCIHGLGFSSNSYSEFGRAMAGHGIAVYALDVRGFGEWMKRTNDKVDFEACLADVEASLRSLHKAYPGVPIFLVGESMGGAIAMQETSRHPELVDGLISSVPSSDRYAKLSSELIVGTRFLADKDKPMDLTPEVINRTTENPTLRKAWLNESTNRMKMTPKELKQFNDFMKGNEDAAVLIDKKPCLMLAGFKDKLVKPEGTVSLFNQLSTSDKLLMVVGDGEHLLFEENQLTTQLETLVVDWIKNESSSRPHGVTAHP